MDLRENLQLAKKWSLIKIYTQTLSAFRFNSLIMQVQSSIVTSWRCKSLDMPKWPQRQLCIFKCTKCNSVEKPRKVLTVLQGCHVPDLPTVKAKRRRLTVAKRVNNKLITLQANYCFRDENHFTAKTADLNCTLTTVWRACATMLACVSWTKQPAEGNAPSACSKTSLWRLMKCF